jgi:acetyltransferase-like isoleucine patch superfamily enzyme
MNKIITYGYWGVICLFSNYLRTKLFYRNSRIIRFPFDIRGRKFVDLGRRLTTGKNCRIEAFPKDNCTVVITIGNDVQLNDYVHITAMKSVRIGNNVLMASKIYISDCTHGYYSGDFTHSHPDLPPMEREYSIKPVVIQDNVWIGESVSVLPGVTIGKGSIIGANSVVSKDIPDYTIAVGIPAKAIKKFNFETLIWENI